MKKTVMICDRCGIMYDPVDAAAIPDKNSRGVLKASRARVTIGYVRPDGCRWRDTLRSLSAMRGKNCTNIVYARE